MKAQPWKTETPNELAHLINSPQATCHLLSGSFSTWAWSSRIMGVVNGQPICHFMACWLVVFYKRRIFASGRDVGFLHDLDGRSGSNHGVN